jgi:hypothetical protein
LATFKRGIRFFIGIFQNSNAISAVLPQIYDFTELNP